MGKGEVARVEERPVSQIVVEFEGPGSANVLRIQFENVSPGQVLTWAKWAELHGQQAFARMQLDEAVKPRIAVPTLGVM